MWFPATLHAIFRNVGIRVRVWNKKDRKATAEEEMNSWWLEEGWEETYLSIDFWNRAIVGRIWTSLFVPLYGCSNTAQHRHVSLGSWNEEKLWKGFLTPNFHDLFIFFPFNLFNSILNHILTNNAKSIGHSDFFKVN